MIIDNMNIIFPIHMLIYWTMVSLYDEKDHADFFVAASNSLKNQLLYTLPLSQILTSYYPNETLGLLPSLFLLPVFTVTGDIYFYITHRPLHTKLLWNYHKTHHRGRLCVAKSLDADLPEHVIGNLGSFVIGISLCYYIGLVPHLYSLYLWTAIATMNTCVSHSNGNAPGDTKDHLRHHSHLNCNYGFGLYLVDSVMGTYRQ